MVQIILLERHCDRTLAVQAVGERSHVMEARTRRRNRRMELRTTAEVRDLIDRAVALTGGDLTEFAISSAHQATQRLLAYRYQFELDPAAAKQWDEIDSRRARELPGLRRLMQRHAPFSD